jgi:hypothetical protein
MTSMCTRRRDAFDERNLALADMLQAWDVLGVYQSADRPRDDEEYDDLVEPIRGWLESGAGPEELSALLVRHLDRDYGLTSGSELAEIDFARRVHEWWSNLRGLR